MRIDRVVQAYDKVLDYKQFHTMCHEIYERYSETSMDALDFVFMIEKHFGKDYVPEKLGYTEIEKKTECSKRMRRKTAEIAAAALCTNTYMPEEYRYMRALMDYSCTKEADESNRKMAEVFLRGEQAEKTDLFWERLKPILSSKESLLEWKTDDELVENWELLALIFYQFQILDKIVAEAKSLGVDLPPEVEDRFTDFQAKGQLPTFMMFCRAGVIANVHYSQINDGDVKKIDVGFLREVMPKFSFTLEDYLRDITELVEYIDENVKDQVKRKLKQLGYKQMTAALLGNMRGRAYEDNMAFEVLKTGRPVYVLGENRKLVYALEVLGTDGFLKPIMNKKRKLLLADYLEKMKALIQDMVQLGQPLSPEGQKTARLYMATMVCYEKLQLERAKGSVRLWHALQDDESKFAKAVNMICEDENFIKLTEDITLESLQKFVKEHGEKKLNRKYMEMRIEQKYVAQDMILN